MKIKAGKYIILLALLLALLLVLPAIVLADSEFTPEEDASLYAQVFDGAGTPVNTSTVSLTLWDPEGNKLIDSANMAYMAGSHGVYKYDFAAPEDEGMYLAEVVSVNPTGYGSSMVHVAWGCNISGNFTIASEAIWGEDVSGYDDAGTFGGLINNLFGGDSMLLLLFGLMAAGFTIAFFVTNRGFLAYLGAGTFLLLGLVAYTQSSSPSALHIQDVEMGLFWIGIVATLALGIYPTATRKEIVAESDDQEDTRGIEGEDLSSVMGKREEESPRSKKNKPSKFSQTGQE